VRSAVLYNLGLGAQLHAVRTFLECALILPGGFDCSRAAASTGCQFKVAVAPLLM
jgi:hypothetical protein